MTEAYPLSWPNGWPRTSRDQRRRALFHSTVQRTREWRDHSTGQTHRSSYSEKTDLTIYAAMRRLTDELTRLGGKDIIVSTNVETRRDGQPRSDRRAPEDPGVAVYFKLKGQDRVLACDKWDRVPDNIAAIAGHVDAIRKQERYGVGTLDQAFAGYAALPPPGHIHVRPWQEVLGLDQVFAELQRVPPNQVALEMAERRFRELAHERHPDRGGSHAQMAELNAAIARARQELGA